MSLKIKERKKESEVAQSCLTLCDPIDCILPGSSVHGIFQARVLEWVAIAFRLEYYWLLPFWKEPQMGSFLWTWKSSWLQKLEECPEKFTLRQSIPEPFPQL